MVFQLWFFSVEENMNYPSLPELSPQCNPDVARDEVLTT